MQTDTYPDITQVKIQIDNLIRNAIFVKLKLVKNLK